MKNVVLNVALCYNLIFTQFSFSQNLVIDGDFEKYSNIPNNSGGENSSYYLHNAFEQWYRVNTMSAAYYNKINACTQNSINITECGVPYHGLNGFQYARSGKGYALWVFVSNKPLPNVIGSSAVGGALSKKLDKYKHYCAGFYTNLQNVSKYKCNGYGMAFVNEKIDTGLTSNPIYYVHMSYLNYQMKAPIDLYIDDTLNWVQVADTFSTQEGNEKYFVISNYLAQNQINFFPTGYSHFGYHASYYIDDVFVYEQKPIWVYDGDVTICDTITYVLRAEQAPEFVWWNINNPNLWLSTRDTLALPPGVGGTYVVRGEACGYVTYDTVTVTRLNCGLGMPGNKNDDDLATIFPNPTSTAFTLKLAQETHTGGMLHINDVNGRQLASHRFTQNNQTISSESLAPGLYALAYEHHGRILWRGKLCVMR